MTAAMIASNSFCRPRSAAAEPMSHTCSTANRHEQNAVSTNSEIFTRRTGTPTFFAALASPPTARIQLPKRVLREHERADRGEREPPENHLGNAGHERLAVIEQRADAHVREPS